MYLYILLNHSTITYIYTYVLMLASPLLLNISMEPSYTYSYSLHSPIYLDLLVIPSYIHSYNLVYPQMYLFLLLYILLGTSINIINSLISSLLSRSQIHCRNILQCLQAKGIIYILELIMGFQTTYLLISAKLNNIF